MANETILCSSCGITLRPFMKVCPRCGAEREDAQPLAPTPSHEIATESTVKAVVVDPANTKIAPFIAMGQKLAESENGDSGIPQNVVFFSPNETQRRFPIFTPSQRSLLWVGLLIVLVALGVGYALWRRQQRDEAKVVNVAPPRLRPTPLTLAIDPAATPNEPTDQTIFEAVKASLAAYNPLRFSHYKFEVKDGVVTLTGDTEHQPEKEGAENVIRMLAGVKSVTNNLKVKPDAPPDPLKVDLTEAKLLDDAMRRQAEENQSPKIVATPLPTPDPQRELERERREQAAARQREEDAALRKAAEEKLKREAEEYEKRQEELRRAEAERRARAEQSRLEANVLRSGTIAWRGIVDGIDEVIISGNSASVRHISGNPPREVGTSFSASMPRSPVVVNLIWTSARGIVEVIQQPSVANGYTAIIRIDDSAKGGDKRYEFTLRWTLQ